MITLNFDLLQGGVICLLQNVKCSTLGLFLWTVQSWMHIKLQIKRHICVMEYFLCLNFYDITTITLLLMGCWLAIIIPKEYFNVEICWTKAWIPNPPGFRSAQRWCVFISSQTNQRQGLGTHSVKNAMKARGLHIIWKVYIFLTSLPYTVEIAGNKNSINFSRLTYSKNDWSGWLHLFFVQGKVIKGK